MSEPQSPALKVWFDANRFRQIARLVGTIEPQFEGKVFLAHGLAGLENLSLMQRLRRMTESLHVALPYSYRKNLEILRELAPAIDHGFVTLVLSDYVALYGLDEFDLSMDALKFFTRFGSSEFAVRHFLRSDLARALRLMENWSRDADEAVRRLASEGTRPRLPWSFRLPKLAADPALAAPILRNLKGDESLYVRKSVANHLNDVTKEHPEWVLEQIGRWDLRNPHTSWIAKRALRSMIKAGDRRALALIGAGELACVRINDFQVVPSRVKLGERVVISFAVQSLSAMPQRLVIDYALHYVKRSGSSSAKVFKLKELVLPPLETVPIQRTQHIRDFTTRVHHPGKHVVEIMVNGEKVAKGEFLLFK